MTKQIKCLVRLIGVCVLALIMVIPVIQDLLGIYFIEPSYPIQLGIVVPIIAAVLSTVLLIHLQRFWLQRPLKSRYQQSLAASLLSSDPPQLAQYLLWYLPRNQRESVMGDLAEDFQCLVTHFGRRKAVVWYYAQVVMSFWPYLERALAKLLRLGVFGWIAEKFGRFIH